MNLRWSAVLLVIGCASAPPPRPPSSTARPPSANASAKAPRRPAAKQLDGILDASQLLVREDLEATLKRPTLPPYEGERLMGDPASATYDSWHFKAIGQPESHDIAFRVWRLPKPELETRWDELKHALPNVTAAARIGAAQAFEAHEPGARILGHGFYDKRHGVIVLVTCGADLCTTPAEARAFATLIHGRLARLR